MKKPTECYICRAPRWNGDIELFTPAYVVKETEKTITVTGVDCDITRKFNKNKSGEFYTDPRYDLYTVLEDSVKQSGHKYYLTFNLQYVEHRTVENQDKKYNQAQADLYHAIKSFPDRFISAGVSEKSTVFNYLIQLINSLPESEK